MSAIPLERTEAAAGPHLHTPFLERASQPGNAERPHALGAFLTLRAVDRISESHGEQSEEGIAFQLRAAANYLEELHPQTKDVSHLREIVRISRRVLTTENRALLWAPLLALAYWLENELRLDESLDVLETAFRLKGGSEGGSEGREEIAGYLQQGRVLRLTGKFVESRDAYEMAEMLAQAKGDFRSEMVSRIGRAGISQKTGSLPGADHELRTVLQLAKERGDSYVEARASHDLAVNAHLMKRTAKAVPLAFRAFELYEEAAQRMRALSDTGIFLKELGHYGAAREALLHVIDSPETPNEVKYNAMLESVELAASISDQLGFERWSRELGSHYQTLLPYQQVDFHMYVGVGLATFGESKEALARLTQAMELGQTYRLGQRVFETERLIGELQEGKATGATSPRRSLSAAEHSDELQGAIDGVYALRESGS